MICFFRIIVLSFLLTLPCVGLAQDHVLLQLKDNEKFVIASEYGLEVYSYGLTRLGSARGSGNVPIDLELKRGEHCFVLTQKTLDYFYVKTSGETIFKRSITLDKDEPTDMEFLNKGKNGRILVLYQSGLQIFDLIWHPHSVDLVAGRSIASLGAIP